MKHQQSHKVLCTEDGAFICPCGNTRGERGTGIGFVPLDANDHLHFPERIEDYRRVNHLCLKCGRVFAQPSLQVLRIIDVDTALRPRDRRMTGEAVIHISVGGHSLMN